MAILTRLLPSPQRRGPAPRACQAGLRAVSALALTAVLRRLYQFTQKGLLVDAQQVRLLVLDVRTDEVAVGGDAQQVPEGGPIPAPGQLELEKCAVVGLELGGDTL